MLSPRPNDPRAAEGREAWERAAQILERISDPFVVIDEGWRYTYVSHQAAELLEPLGWRPEALLGVRVWEAFPNLAGTAWEDAARRALAERAPATAEIYYAPLGSWLEYRFHPSAEGLAVYLRDITERKRAEEAQRFLAEAGAVLASALDFRATLQRLAQLVVGRFADGCAIDVVTDPRGVPGRGGAGAGAAVAPPASPAPGGPPYDSGEYPMPGRSVPVERVAVAGREPEDARLLAELARRDPMFMGAPSGWPKVLRTGEPQLVEAVDDAVLRASAPDAEQLALLRALRMTSLLAVPLVGRGRTLGAITVFSRDPARRYGAADLDLVAELARRAALAVDNARLYAHATQARAEAERERRRAAGILDSIADAFVVYDREWRFTYVNREAERIFLALGKSRADVMGRSLWESFPDIRGSAWDVHFHRAIERGAPVAFEEYYPLLDVWWDVHVYPSAEGVSVYFRNVTARKRAEEQQTLLADASTLLAASLDYRATLEALARLVVDRLADGCAIDMVADLPLAVDSGGDAGNALAAIHLPAPGQTAEYAAAARPTLERLTIVTRDPAKAELVRELERRFPTPLDAPAGNVTALRTGQSQLYESISDETLRAVSASEEHFRLWREIGMHSVMCVPLVARGRTLGVLTLVSHDPKRRFTRDHLALAEDLARRAALAVDNARLYEAALAASRSKSDFLAVMSHELRTPLSAVIGYGELLADEILGPLSSVQKEYLGRVKGSAQHLLSLIEEILTFSRMEAGQERVLLDRVDACAVADEAVALTSPLAGKRRLAIELRRPPDPLPVRTDAQKLRQILVNLLANAIKFTERGTISLTVAAGDGRVTFAIADTGLGIAPEHLERIFEPFWQVEQSTTRRVGGTGLGLSVARQLARLLGGDVTVRSAVGEGSVFVVELPAA